MYLASYLSIFLAIYPSTYLSIHLSIYLPVYLILFYPTSILLIYLIIHLSAYLSIMSIETHFCSAIKTRRSFDRHQKLGPSYMKAPAERKVPPGQAVLRT